MRILITNDDGINAPGLGVLHAIATEIAGPEGEVWTVAPAFEQSGVGHCINYTRPTMISQFGERRFACEGSPADCVLAALGQVLRDTPPDLVLSGVNRGNNAAENTLYSGTIGAAIEAALQGTRAIALSQFYGPGNRTLDDPFEAAVVHGAKVVQGLWDSDLWGGDDYQLFYNVNFPPVAADKVKGMQACAQGTRPGVNYSVVPGESPSGRQFLWIKGGAQDVPSAEGTDAKANLDGYISVTPMRADLTDHATLDALKAQWT
ncbi:MAG: 5'/3'-nucleotidase SurE [Paracoccaceae bacterium]|nr:5'/3'-nucleotidase SurE [Loktanella sp.]